MNKHVNFEKGYNLITQEVNSNVTVEVIKKTNHVFIVDVSGSMSGELPLIRKQLKNKLSNIMKEGDTISIIWFSGKNDAGILKEEVEVKGLKSLNDLHDAIDKYLRPVCLTAFLKPLQLLKDLVKRVSKNRPDYVFSMIFLTDGCNNDCPWNEVTKTLKELENDIAYSTFIEYGFWADSEKLTQMAGILGGEKISCDGFDEFEPVFDKKITTNLSGGKKVSVELCNSHLYDFAFSIGSDGSVVLYNIENNNVLIGSDVREIHFFSEKEVGENTAVDTTLYAAIYVLSDKILNDDAEKIFTVLGDKHYFNILGGAFGKQKLNEFKNAIKECIIDTSKRFIEGKVDGKTLKIDENAYCLLNLINDLGSIDDCLFYPNHESFDYNRIGVKRIAKGSELSDEDKQRLTEAKNVDEANKILEELKTKNVDLKFINTDPTKGYPLTDLVYNEERANLSVRVKYDGKVELPQNKFNVSEINTFIYRTYTLVKDGIVNLKKLPVSYSDELLNILTKNNVKSEVENGTIIIIDLSSIPVINKGMIKGLSAVKLANNAWTLQKLQADKKVYDYYRKSLFPKESKSFIEVYGQECADWLKEIGITDFNGFAPKTDAAESTDVYTSVNLLIKIAGISSLPKVEDVITKMKSGKPLKVNEWIMSDAINKYQAQTESDIYKSLDDKQKEEVLKTYLISKSVESNKLKRNAMQVIAQSVFSLIYSKKWLKEFKTFDEKTLNLTLDGQNLTFTFDLCEKEVKI